METMLHMFTTTLGSAAVIAAVIVLFYSSKKRSELHKTNKGLHRVIIAVLFGLLSIYASVSAVNINGSLSNCRNLPPLYAGLVGGPFAGIIAALIGGLFRYFVYGGVSAVPCMLACLIAGVIGSAAHKLIKKEYRYNVLTGACLSLVTEGIHMLLLCVFGLSESAAVLALPIVCSSVLGMMFCLYVYQRFNKSDSVSEAK